MPVVTFDARELRRILGQDVPTATLVERMPHLGGEVAGVEGDTIHMEWFPNRTDLLTLEGTGRAVRAFLGIKPGLTAYKVEKPRTELTVDPSVAAVRPFAALCFVRNVPFDDAYVKSVIDAQEKLTLSPGRKRRKIAIGIHDAKGTAGPFTYTVVGPRDKPFVALNESTPRTPADIVATHPKGKEYGHLLPPGRFPVFLDSKGDVLSLPPVINAQRTAVSAATRDVLVDVTGTDLPSVKATIALLATGFAERGGTIEGVTVHDASGTWTSPDLKPSERVLHVDDVSKLLGHAFSGEEAALCLRRLGHEATAFDTKVHVRSPAWRFDLFHPVDLIEDVAIGFGYERLPRTLPKAGTFGGKLPHQGLEDAARTALVGQGWHEAKTLTLSDPKAQWRNWGEADGRSVQLLNPVLEDQTVLRTKLVPSLLGVLATNRHRSLPQRLFEAGYVVLPDGKGGWPNRLHLAGAELSARANFSDAKGLVLALLRDLRLDAKVESDDRPGYIKGRQGKVVAGGKAVGHFGELHPDTIVNFGLGAPCIAFELDLAAFAPT
jgi:phenylalanyl-tRNA synthetase beta chain